MWKTLVSDRMCRPDSVQALSVQLGQATEVLVLLSEQVRVVPVAELLGRFAQPDALVEDRPTFCAISRLEKRYLAREKCQPTLRSSTSITKKHAQGIEWSQILLRIRACQQVTCR